MVAFGEVEGQMYEVLQNIKTSELRKAHYFLHQPSYFKHQNPSSFVTHTSNLLKLNSYEERNLETDLATHPFDYHGYCHHVRGHVVHCLNEE